MPVLLYGYRYSVYTRIARVVLAEKGVSYERREVNPFADDMPRDYLEKHPFRRVPALQHGNAVIYETGAITRYIDEAFAGPVLQPSDARERARMAQIVSILDAYGYWPMVRQVFAHRVFRPRIGHDADEGQIHAGLEASATVLQAVDSTAASSSALAGDRLSLADFHLAPMIAYFAAAREGAAALSRYPKLSAWWETMHQRASLKETDPGLPEEPSQATAR